jgi:hypothetical protein
MEKLPADHPSREDLYEHVEELVDTLVWQEQHQFDPVRSARAWIGILVVSAAYGLVGAKLIATSLAMDPQPRPAWAAVYGAHLGLVLVSVGSLVAWLVRWCRERDLDDDDPERDPSTVRHLLARHAAVEGEQGAA